MSSVLLEAGEPEEKRFIVTSKETKFFLFSMFVFSAAGVGAAQLHGDPRAAAVLLHGHPAVQRQRDRELPDGGKLPPNGARGGEVPSGSESVPADQEQRFRSESLQSSTFRCNAVFRFTL